ncbi:hypothetical protein KGR20_10340, partial [Cytobacillus oceanisediminis]|uniref:hypothetical protein n=1 Tax=Cytobacillus oceanisediminis TaxID=665099 RepID=UPI001CCAF177
ALDNLNSNHWCVCQERLRASPLQKGKKKKTSGYFFIEVLTLPSILYSLFPNFHILTNINKKSKHKERSFFVFPYVKEVT